MEGCRVCPTLYETSESPITRGHGASFAGRLIFLLGKTRVSRQQLVGCGCWDGWGCDLGGRVGGRGAMGGWWGGRQPCCASFLAFLGRAAGRRGRRRGPAGRNANTGEGEKKGRCVCHGKAKPGPGLCGSPCLSHPSLHRGMQGSLRTEMVAVLGVAAVLYGMIFSRVPWGGSSAPAPLAQELDFPREGSIVWGRVFLLLLELGACLSQT